MFREVNVHYGVVGTVCVKVKSVDGFGYRWEVFASALRPFSSTYPYTVLFSPVYNIVKKEFPY